MLKKLFLLSLLSAAPLFTNGQLNPNAETTTDLEAAELTHEQQQFLHLFYAIAQGDLDLVRSLTKEQISINGTYPNNMHWDVEHTPTPAVGDTPLIYAVKTIIHLAHLYHQRRYSDELSFQYAIERRVNIVQELIYNPKCNVFAENAEGHTALSLAAQADINSLAQLIVNSTHVAPKQETAQYREKLAKLELAPAIRERIEKEIANLGQKHPSEKAIATNYVNTLLELPWSTVADTTITISEVAQALDEDHFGLRKVKDSIIEFLAVKALNPHKRGKILCLVGPPGTGKTSVVQSIARGLKRPMARLGLGGAHDEPVIRGHIKAYISADMGGIIKGIKQAKVKDPVFLLDEIDKLGNGNHNGNPASALLEALDPEQNHAFMDRYIDIPFDLSQVIFIATANSMETIPLPLLDRLEIIRIPGYSLEEKLEIAKKYIVPKVIKEYGLADANCTLSDEIIRAIIKEYTFEPGVRQLTKKIQLLASKGAKYFLEHKTLPTLTLASLRALLGTSNQLVRVSTKPTIGVVNCLAVYPDIGGVTSFLEIILIPNGTGKLQVSSTLINDSKNAAEIALSYVRSHAQEFGIAPGQFTANDMHVHSPGIGHVDGPSAGIANVTALVSAFTKKPCDPSFAMTGELSLTGRVMAIGGLKEKILAAKRVGITKVIIPQENEPELAEFRELLDGMEIIPVSDVKEVLAHVLMIDKKTK